MSYKYLDKNGLSYFWSKLKAKIGTATLTTTAQDLSGAVNELNSKSASTIIMGNFTGTIQRLGKLRIISLYNSTDVQAATSKQLEANDYPATNISVGAWLLVDSNNNFGSRYLELSTTGLLSTSGTVVRGGWVMVYYTN